MASFLHQYDALHVPLPNNRFLVTNVITRLRLIEKLLRADKSGPLHSHFIK